MDVGDEEGVCTAEREGRGGRWLGGREVGMSPSLEHSASSPQ